MFVDVSVNSLQQRTDQKQIALNRIMDRTILDILEWMLWRGLSGMDIMMMTREN
jgi:hypothetical protein